MSTSHFVTMTCTCIFALAATKFSARRNEQPKKKQKKRLLTAKRSGRDGTQNQTMTIEGYGRHMGRGDDRSRRSEPPAATDPPSASTIAVFDVSDNENSEEDQAPPSQQRNVEEACRELVERKIQEWQRERSEHLTEEFSSLLSRTEQELAVSMVEAQRATNERSQAHEHSSSSPNNEQRKLLEAFRRSLDTLEELEQMEGNRNNEKDQQERLPQDTFSFLMVTSATCGTGSSWRPFLCGIGPLVLQLTTLALMVSDTLDGSTEQNALNLPVDIDVTVRLAQVVALVITVVTQEDVIVALSQIADGYHACDSLQDDFPRLSKKKWTASVLCRLFVGLLVLFVAFLLVVQQESVVEIFLNFLAIEFVSELDNISFHLALRGFGGIEVRRVARAIENSYFSPNNPTNPGGASNSASRRCHFRRWNLIAIILVLVMTSWAWVFQRQTSGDLLARDIIVQFDDSFEPALATFSGLYSLRKARLGGRATYVEKRLGRGMLGYCESIEAWTFTFDSSAKDACVNIRAKSLETRSYDLLSTRTSMWFDVDADQGDLPMERLFMTSYDCREEGICGSHGTCVGRDGCFCDDGWFGLRCEFPNPCAAIEIDERREGFLGTRQWSTQFQLLRDSVGETVMVYSKPVYAKPSDTDPQIVDIIIFTGRRWMMTHSGLLSDFKSNQAKNMSQAVLEELSNYIAADFHAYWSNFQAAFVSEAVDIATPRDSATPINVQWFETSVSVTEQTVVASADESSVVQTILLCKNCNNITNPCFFDNVCGSDGRCECPTGSSGTLCQIPPVSNARYVLSLSINTLALQS